MGTHTKYAKLGTPKHLAYSKRQLALACVCIPEEFRKYAIEGTNSLTVINLNLVNLRH
jgi:hypothetical protein